MSYQRLRGAIDQAYERGYLGKDILGSGYNLELSILRGAGAYICGEETSLLSSSGGRDGVIPSSSRPFRPREGLYRKPTIINNVETLFNVPFIVANGADWYRQWGTERSPGLKLFCVSGHVERPGTYELPMATPMRELIYDVCGGPKGWHPAQGDHPRWLVHADDARRCGPGKPTWTMNRSSKRVRCWVRAR